MSDEIGIDEAAETVGTTPERLAKWAGLPYPPDTTEAVTEVLASEFEALTGPIDGRAIAAPYRVAKRILPAIVAAYRKSLAEQGWTETPVVKVKRKVGTFNEDRLWALGYNAALRDLQSLGLPIQLEEE